MRRLLESEENYIGPVAQKVALLSARDEISAIDFSPDGEHLAVAAALGPNIYIWKWNGQSREEQTLQIPQGLGPGTGQSGLRYSPNGLLIAAVHARSRATEGYGVVRIWDARTGKVEGQISEPLGGGNLGRLAFTPDSKYLLRTYDRIETVSGDHFSVHSVGGWDALWGIRTSPFIPEALAVSRDGKMAALGGEVFDHEHVSSQIRIIDIASHLITTTIDTGWRNVAINQVALSSDGKRVAVGTHITAAETAGPAVAGFDIATGHSLFQQTVAQFDATGVAFTPDEKYFVQAGKGLPVEIWDSEHVKLLQRIPASATALSLSPDGHHFAVAEGSTISVWEFR